MVSYSLLNHFYGSKCISQDKFPWITAVYGLSCINIKISSKKNLENATLLSCEPFSQKIQELGKHGKLKDLSAILDE